MTAEEQFPYKVRLKVLRTKDLPTILQTVPDWCRDRWGPNKAMLYSFSYLENGAIAQYSFAQPQHAMLFKLTWSEFL